MSLLAVAAYHSYTKKRKLSPAVDKGGISEPSVCSKAQEDVASKPTSYSGAQQDGASKLSSRSKAQEGSVSKPTSCSKAQEGDVTKPTSYSNAQEGDAESKKSEQASYVWETDRFVVICEDEYESSNRNNEGMEVANSSQPRSTSSPLAKMLQDGSKRPHENTVQEESLGASTICTNDQASLRFEDDYIGEVDSYACSKPRKGEDDGMSSKRLASFWRKKRLAQLENAQDAATDKTETLKEQEDLHRENIGQAEEGDASISTKVISHRTGTNESNSTAPNATEVISPRTGTSETNSTNSNTTKIISHRTGTNETESILVGKRSESSFVVSTKGGCNALCDTEDIEAEVEQVKVDLKKEMKVLQKELGLDTVENRKVSEEGALDEGSTWTRDTKEPDTASGAVGRFDQELNVARDFFTRGAREFIGFLASAPTQGCTMDSTEDSIKMKKSGDSEEHKTSNKNHVTGDKLEDVGVQMSDKSEKSGYSEDFKVQVTNKPMVIHTQTRSHGARIVKGIHSRNRTLPPGIPRQQIRHTPMDADMDDRSDAYTLSAMKRDTICVEDYKR